MAKYLVTSIVNFKHQYLVEADDPDHVWQIWADKSNFDNVLHMDFIGENVADVKHIKTDEEYNDILDESDNGEDADEIMLTAEGIDLTNDEGEQPLDKDVN